MPTPSPTKPPRGHPPAEAAVLPPPDPTPPPDDALSRLAARARAPREAAEAAGEALRAAMAVYVDRAAACLARLRRLQPEVDAQLSRVALLEQENEGHNLSAWELQPGGGKVKDVRAAVKRLQPLYHVTLSDDRTVPPTTAILAGIAGRVATLEARDAHACPAYPPGCGCVLGMIRQHVEDAEASARQVPGNLAWLIDALAQLDAALTVRADAAAPVHRAPQTAGVSVTTPTGPPTVRPPSGPAVRTAFDPLEN